MSVTSEWVSLGEAARIIGVHPATIRNWAERGDLPCWRTPGGHRRFRRADLKQWISAHPARPYTREAQLVVQSALGRTRLEIADCRKPATDAWYHQISDAGREAIRQGSLQLMDGLIQHLSAPREAEGMAIAEGIGTAYGRLLRGENLTLSQALHGYLTFSDFLLDAVLEVAETDAGRAAIDWNDMLRQVPRLYAANPAEHA